MSTETKTSYFTFGQCHEHVIQGFVWDKDIICKITAPEPRDVMIATFGLKWSMEYDEPPSPRLFPRGIKELAV